MTFENDELYVDHEGAAMQGMLEARREAGRVLAGIAHDNFLPDGLRPPVLRIVVRSQDGEHLWETVLRWEERQLSRPD
ncbi:DUF6894 family protein [Devosia sp. A16]|uniref:DUF6894 family protein n=1 Tax=Devosia sp. A16 TaxID=1736675 RepID=UPI0006D80FBE